MQHSLRAVAGVRGAPAGAAPRLSRGTWARMLLRYQVDLRAGGTSARPTRRTRGAGAKNRVVLAKKRTKHAYHHGVYHTLVGLRALRGKLRRGARRAVYEVLDAHAPPRPPRRRDAVVPMKLLFLARHWSYFRNFESAIDALAARGHALHLAVDREESMGGRQMVERLVERIPTVVSMGNAPGRGVDGWSELARKIRLGLDYLRFLEPAYAETPHLRRPRARAGAGGRRAC